MKPYRICFVCLGNICRSPMAEWVLRQQLEETTMQQTVEVDSAGMAGWHAGKGIDPRAQAALQRRGYCCEHHSARQFQPHWFKQRDLVIALDRSHFLSRMASHQGAVSPPQLLGSFDPRAGNDLDVPDPYYGDRYEFDHCLDLIESACSGLLTELLKREEPS